MGYQFPLATVLRVRGIVEDREERMLQRILHEISQTLKAIDQIDVELANTNSSRTAQVFKASTGMFIHASYGQIEQLKKNRQELEEKVEKLKELRDTQLEVYRAAHRDREMLTDMQEKKRGLYETDLAKREQSTLDDNYIARRGRIQ